MDSHCTMMKTVTYDIANMVQLTGLPVVCNKRVESCLWIIPMKALGCILQHKRILHRKVSFHQKLLVVSQISILLGNKIAAMQWRSEKGALPVSHTENPQNLGLTGWWSQGWICRQRPTVCRLRCQSGCRPSGSWGVHWVQISQDMSSRYLSNKQVVVDCRWSVPGSDHMI